MPAVDSIWDAFNAVREDETGKYPESAKKLADQICVEANAVNEEISHFFTEYKDITH